MRYSDRHISDEELDQLFRDAHASEGQESLFVPEFWSEMESLLPPQQEKKRGFYGVPLIASLLLTGMILSYPWHAPRIERLSKEQTALLHEGSSSGTSKSLAGQDGVSRQDEKQVAKSSQINRLNSGNQPVKKTSGNRYTPVANKPVPGEAEKHHPFMQREVTDRGNENPAVLTGSEADLNSGLDSIQLTSRYELVPHEEIATLPAAIRESNEWYVELGPTVGQSPYLSQDQKRNVVAGVILGGGYTKRIDQAFVSFGLQARMEGFGGLEYRETNFSPDIVRTVTVKQLYSVEVPLKFGYIFKRSELAFGVVPGVQLFVHGKEQILENKQVERQKTFTGKVEHSNSLTMEFGFQYYYNFTSKWGLGAKLNADILRPFHTDYYLGKSAGFPVNGQLVLRARLSK